MTTWQEQTYDPAGLGVDHGQGEPNEDAPALHMSDDLATLVRQSKLCHPDWDAATHLAWLDQEGITGSDLVHFIGTLSGHRDTVADTVTFWIDRGGLR